MINDVKLINIGFASRNIYFNQCALILESEIKPNIDNLKELTSSTVEENDTVYFHDSSMVPRFKFLEYCKDKKIRRVINFEKATKLVINEQHLNAEIKRNFSKSERYVRINYFELDLFRAYYSNIRIDNLDANSNIFISEPHLKQIQEIIGNTLSLVNTFDSYYLTYSYNLNDFSKSCIILNKIRNITAGIVFDAVLNKQMSKESIIIDKDNFDQINDMLKSSDKSNILLGIEIMANSNYVESIFYISLLLNGNNNAINSVPIKNVNAKNFIEFFRDVQWMSSPYDFLFTLREKLIKEELLDEVKDLYIHKTITDVVNTSLSRNKIYVEGHITFTNNPRKSLPIV